MRHEHRLTISTISLLVACSASAGSVYKSVDAQGRVTYSSTPPANAREEMIEQVRIDPGPTEQQKQDAAERANALEANKRRAEQDQQQEETRPSNAVSDDGEPTATPIDLDRVGSTKWRAPRASPHDRTTRPGIER